MAYEVPQLPYDYAALEPHIDAQTMQIHHDKHHQAYVDKVNAALEGTDLDGKPIEEVLKNLDAVPSDKQKAVRNNGGGHYNHSLFWEWLSPDGGGEPDGALAEAIDAAFGSFADFQAKFKDAGVNQFGSGWAWLVHDGSGLAVTSTANQDSPVSFSFALKSAKEPNALLIASASAPSGSPPPSGLMLSQNSEWL